MEPNERLYVTMCIFILMYIYEGHETEYVLIAEDYNKWWVHWVVTHLIKGSSLQTLSLIEPIGLVSH